MHKHFCLRCETVVEEGEFDCEIDADHDYCLCDRCAEIETEDEHV